MGEFKKEHLPDAVSYFEAEGLGLQGRGKWRTTECRFHGGSDSMRINTATGGWVCMSCNAKGGDVLAHFMAEHGVASRMERIPAISEAITAARATVQQAAPEFADAESYLTAVVMGTIAPDPMRINAAKTLIGYQRARQRAPMASATPTQLNKRAAADSEQDFLNAWAKKAATVRAKLAN